MYVNVEMICICEEKTTEGELWCMKGVLNELRLREYLLDKIHLRGRLNNYSNHGEREKLLSKEKIQRKRKSKRDEVSLLPEKCI